MLEAVGAHCAVITTGIEDIVHKCGAKSPDYRKSIILVLLHSFICNLILFTKLKQHPRPRLHQHNLTETHSRTNTTTPNRLLKECLMHGADLGFLERGFICIMCGGSFC